VPPGRPADEVVITGVGCAGPFGGRETFWARLLAADRAVRRLTPADFRSLPFPEPPPFPPIGAPASGHATTSDAKGAIGGSSASAERRATPPLADEPPVAPRRTEADPLLDLLLAASTEALDHAVLHPGSFDHNRVGCVIGTSKGGLFAFGRCYAGHGTGADWAAFPPHAGSTAVAARHGLRGPCLAPVAACATGLVSVLRGADLIRSGACDLVLAGSGDASLHPAVLASFRRMGVLATRFTVPASACRPFSADRDGFAVGEGAAVFVLERRRNALARGATPLAALLGGALLSDPAGLTAVDVRGETLTRAVRDTLRAAGLAPSDVAHINLHGTATRTNDVAEAAGLRAALGPALDETPCVALKAALGHQLGAAGAVELAATALALRDGRLPPTVNLTDPDPACRLPLSAESVSVRGPGLKVSLGFGGHVAVACLAPA
jgi:3-oxoacyl-[acyl-carrier-protein] synthase II